jgi:ferredoxin
MERRVIYCSACDRNIQVVLPEHRAPGGEPDLHGAVCLDIGETCTGTMCPVGAISPDRIRRELETLKERGEV